MFDGAEAGRCVIGSQAAFVIAEDHVHDPVQTVLGGPVAAHDRPRQVRRQQQGRDGEAGLLPDLAATLVRAFDHDHGVQSGPGMSFLQPGDVVDHGGGPGLDPAVIAIDRLAPADPGVLAAGGFLLGHEEFYIGA